MAALCAASLIVVGFWAGAAPANAASGTPTQLESVEFTQSSFQDQSYQTLNVTWKATQSPATPTVTVDFDLPAELIGQVNTFSIGNGTCSVTETHVTCTVDDDYVVSHPNNLRGTFSVQVQVNVRNTEDVPAKTFEVGGVTTPPVQVDTRYCTENCTFGGFPSPYKGGYYNNSNDNVYWWVSVPTSGDGVRSDDDGLSMAAGQQVEVTDNFDENNPFTLVEGSPQLYRATCWTVNEWNEPALSFFPVDASKYTISNGGRVVDFTTETGDGCAGVTGGKNPTPLAGAVYQVNWTVHADDKGRGVVGPGQYKNDATVAVNGESRGATATATRYSNSGTVIGDNFARIQVRKAFDIEPGVDMPASVTVHFDITYPGGVPAPVSGTVTLSAANSWLFVSDEIFDGAIVTLREENPWPANVTSSSTLKLDSDGTPVAQNPDGSYTITATHASTPIAYTLTNRARLSIATPVDPTVVQSVCQAGVPSVPSVTLPENTEKVVYSKSGDVTPGSTVTVTATAQGEYRFPSTVEGWSITNGGLTATKTIVLSSPDCGATPVDPTVVQSVCQAGVPSVPSVTLPENTDKVVYSKSGDVTPGSTVTVTATAQGEYRFPSTVEGWSITNGGLTATKTIVLSSPDCGATPVDPTVVQSVCQAGVPSVPSVTLPENTEKVVYSKSGDVTPGSTVTVTATAQGEYRFPSTVEGWTITNGGLTATKTIVLSSPDCGATPVNPTVVQSVCQAGVPSVPSVTLPENTDKVVYSKSGDVTPGSTVTVTATAQGEYRFPSTVEGWTITNGGLTATKTIVLSSPDCGATPVDPTVVQSVCQAGVPSVPSVTLPENTDKVVYSKSGDVTPGSTVTVTATAQGEYRFPSTVEGWSITNGGLTATKTIVLSSPDCGATPVDPTVVQSVCQAGVPSVPSVTLPENTEKVVYSKSGDVTPGSTVTVTATAQGEYRFPSTVTGWTVSSDGVTATQTIVLSKQDCAIAPPKPGTPLATTGSDFDPTGLWLGGLGLVIAGGLVLGLRRLIGERRH